MEITLTAIDRLVAASKSKRTALCAGLDPRLHLVPKFIRDEAKKRHGKTLDAVGWAFVHYNRKIIDAVAPYVVAIKPQIAFYKPYGHSGIWAFEDALAYGKSKGLITIADVKCGDGEDTGESLAGTYLGEVPFWEEEGEELTQVASPLQADFTTIVAYIGSAWIKPVVQTIKKHGNGAFVVVKTSYRQNSEVEQLETAKGIPVWQAVAELVEEWGRNTEGACGKPNLGAVLGATYPGDAPAMRRYLPESPFLVPGYLGQGATADDAVAGFSEDGVGSIVNSSRAIMYAYCYRDKRFQGAPEEFEECAAGAAEAARDELNDALMRKLAA